MRRFGIILFSLCAGVVGLVFAALIGGWFFVRSSLPPLSGELTTAGLAAELTINRDSLGVPTIRAATLRDAVFGQGFVHGQDRFFQMDLLRRLVSGEMAALVGEPALPSDRQFRPYGYRRAAELHLANLDPAERDLLDAYVDGVNAGFSSLARRPPEYLVLRVHPEPWEPVDTMLSFLYFYIGLSTHYRSERHLRPLYDVLPAELADFLTPDASRFDAPVLGASDDDPTGGYEPAAIPGPEVVDLRNRSATAPGPAPTEVALDFGPQPGGSNAWAIRGEDGSTLLANDPHLAISVPGIWYRVQMEWGQSRVLGVSPPGLPGVFIGMSRGLAWGVTAAIVDQTDLVEVELDPDDPLRYRVPGGWDTLVVRDEQLAVRGADSRTLQTRETRWGPILFTGDDDVPLALRSPAFDPGGVTLRQLAILESAEMEDLVQVLRELGGPGLSILMADREGRIGWVVSGVLPLREGFSGRRPVSFATPGVGWAGVRSEDDRPVVILDEPGRLHTANQRLLPLAEARELSHQWMPSPRASRIRDVTGREGFGTGIDASHELQLDTRSLLHEPLRQIALDAIPDDPEDERLDSLRVYLRDWDGNAGSGSPHFRAVVRTGSQLLNGVLSPLLAPVRLEAPGFRYTWEMSDEPALRILEEQPEHLLPEGYPDWDRYIQSLLLLAVESLESPDGDGLSTPWGEDNRLSAQHPFGQISPALGRFLNLPNHRQPGWSGTVRASSQTYGQSFRMVARPGDFQTATFQMPGGQSGHPMSRYYQRGHWAWADGTPARLEPGPSEYSLTLYPDP